MSIQNGDSLSPLKRAYLAIEQLEARLERAERAQHAPIAIIGAGLRFPGGATDLESYWRLITGGVDAISLVPPDRWDNEALYDPDPDAPGKIASRFGGFVQGVDQFDPLFFGISPREAAAMDPQQRLLLETAWEALERAGISADRIRGSLTGVFIGLASNDYALVEREARGVEGFDQYYASGYAHSIASGRLAYTLDLQGPSVSIDTACSSSLVSIHLAVQSLRARDCNLALAGGVNLMLSAETSIALSRLRMLATDGRCKAFDASADGFVRGEGCGIVALKRLADAQADGDPILAVIRGSAVNQDGRSSGLTAPNGPSQEAVIRSALADAGLLPSEVHYVEAHGTGTSLGDPIEARALSATLGDRGDSPPLVIGSVKTNVGHLEAAAGVAGLLKVALMLRHGQIAPSLHFNEPSPHIPWDELPLRVPTSLEPWPVAGERRVAGVSSFGFSGTNAHLLLESAPRVAPRAPKADRDVHLLPLSAQSPAALSELAGRYAAHLTASPELGLADVVASAAGGRAHHAERATILATNTAEAIERLSSVAADTEAPGVRRGRARSEPPAVAFLFTGQGSQYAGMGRDLYASQPAFLDALDRCAALLEPHLDQPLLEVIFAAPDTPEAALLDQTEYTQPALFALEYALAELWQAWGMRPAAVAGHSLGEYVAACVAGVLSLEDALKLVALRGRLMGRLPAGGAMAAIFAPEATVRDAIASFDEQLAVAAINGPEHTVISGVAAAVEQVSEALATGGVRVRPLTVSHAFHSPLMDPILDEFTALAEQITFQPPRIPLVANLTGAAWGAGEAPDAGYWRRHLREPVRFMESLRSLHDLGCEVFVEVGPAPALSGMGRATLPDTAAFAPSLRASDGLQMLKALGILYTRGVPVDWAAVTGNRPRRHLHLPTYPWQRERYWFEQSASGSKARLALPNRLHPLIDRELRSPALKDHVFETNLDRAVLPYLDGHRVYGTMIFPAAAFLELAVAAGEALDGRAYAVREMTFDAALAIPDDRGCTVQTILQRDGDELSFEVSSSVEGDDWRRHVTGRLAPALAVGPVSTLDEARAAYSEEMTGAAMYERYTALGMQYGPAFQGIIRLWRGPDSALGEIVLPAEAGDTAGYRMHPALMDACLQMAGALLPDEEDTTYLPINLESVTVRAQPGPRVWCHATALPAGDSSTLICSFDIFDSDGAVVATIDRVTLRRASRAALAAVLGTGREDAPLYDLVWREVPRELTAGLNEPGRWLVFSDSDGIGEDLARLLVTMGDQVDLVFPGVAFNHDGPGSWRLDPADGSGFSRLLVESACDLPLRGVVYLWGISSSATARHANHTLDVGLQGALHLAQALAEEEPAGLWLVTHGAQPAAGDVVTPEGAAIWGFARTLAREHPALRPVCVDLEPGPGGDPAAELLAELSAGDGEDSVALRGGRRLAARLVRHRTATSVEQPLRLEIDTRGSLDSLELRPVDRRRPGPGEIEIKVHATGLNFRDVLNVLDLYPGPVENPGSECSGVVTAIGEGVTDWKVGDSVVAITEGCFSTYAVAPARLTARLPRGVSYTEAATIPVAFVTAAYALRHLAGIGQGTRVLIHAASGGVGQAALQIAQAAGAEVFATAGNDEKRAFLRSLGVEHIYDSRSVGFAAAIRAATDGAGVDIVLNSLTDELIPESLAALRDGGCFLEIGKRGIWSPGQVTALGRGIDYHVIYMGEVYERQPELARDLLRSLCGEFESGTLKPLPLRSYPLSRYADAFRLMGQTRHIGKVVLTQTHPLPIDPLAAIRTDASYLITGGTGGLGPLLARWLVDQGARHLVLVGRREPSSSVQATIGELEETGARVLALQADVSCGEDVARVLESIEAEMPPLAGIVHAAGALDDGVIVQQTWPRFEKVLAPKLRGAWNLSQLTLDRPLDFFLMFSSAAALIGQPSQANYAAANATLDGLAHWRRARGLPALSINWGAWGEAGMAAGLEDDQRRRMAGQGIQSLSTEEGLRSLESALATGQAQVAVFPVDWDRLAREFAPGSIPSLFRDLVRAPSGDVESGETNGSTIVDRLAMTPPSLRHGALHRFVREQAAHVLGLANVDDLPAGRPLSELGLDSLMAVDMRNMLGRVLNLTLPTTLLFDHPTPDELTDYLLPLLPGSTPGDPEPEPELANGRPEEDIDLAALTDEEAEALLLAELGDG